MCYTEVQTLA